MKQIRLLIIDQHKGVRDALTVRLGSAPDICVVGTVSPAEAAGLAHRGVQVDVALLGLTGRREQLAHVVDLVKLLVMGETAVIALTSFVDDQSRELILQAGASDYLLKNINTPALLAEISLLAESDKSDS